MNELVTSFDEHQANEKIRLSYPYILVHGTGDALTVTMESIKEGPVPVLIEYKGITYNIGSISKSALELSKLLRVFKFTIYLSEVESYPIKSNLDILEVGVW